MTASKVQIRFAQRQDCKLILDFITQLAIYEKLEHEVSATVEALQNTLFGEKPHAEVVILEEQQRPVGFALFFHNYSTFLAQPGLYLEDLFVLPEYRGKGYGTLLLSFLADLAVQRDCGRFEWSVLDWNTPALRVYERLGALPMSEWTSQRLTGEALQKLAESYRK
ncbi:MAG: GNAT family N-acetyltransferase [Bdellovibrionaceae bacterium]|nr:GNAT family N-acetyltransferase [Pseudobdellovibrionaceae bacterium]